MSHRIEQVESLLQRTVAEVLQRRISDPRIEGMVSVTRVKVSPDMHDAQVYVSILPERFERKTIAGLGHATRHIQRYVREAVALRTVPHLNFRLDKTLKKEADVLDAIREGMQRSGPDDTPGSEETQP